MPREERQQLLLAELERAKVELWETRSSRVSSRIS